MKLRVARNSDLKAVAKLNAAVFPETPFSQSFLVFKKAFANKIASACLVAEDNGTLVGAIIAEKKVSFTPDTSYITSFFVAKEWREKGVGTQLMKRCLAALKKKRISSVSLTVHPTNKKARKLYEKTGFKLYRLIMEKKV